MIKLMLAATALTVLMSPAYAHKARKRHVSQGYQSAVPVVAGSDAIRVNQAGQVLSPPINIKSSNDDGKPKP